MSIESWTDTQFLTDLLTSYSVSPQFRPLCEEGEVTGHLVPTGCFFGGFAPFSVKERLRGISRPNRLFFFG